MTPEEYQKKIAEFKKRTERSIVGQIPSLEKQVNQLLLDWIDDNLDIKNGDFVPNERAVTALNNFSDVYTEMIAELADYKGSVGKYLKNFKSAGKLMEEFNKSQGLDVKRANLGSVQEIVINEIINAYSQNGLNEKFVQPLRQVLFENVANGLSKKGATAQIREFIQGGKDSSGKLHRYLEQTAQQGVDSYEGAVNTRIMKTFDIDTLIMSGSLIDTSSPQCQYAVKELDAIIDREDWPKLKAIAEDNGLIEGTTFDNLPFNKLHWGCRHSFTPAVLTESQRKKIAS
jgi:hypothetical protein